MIKRFSFFTIHLPLVGVNSPTGDEMSKDATLKSSKEANGAGPRGFVLALKSGGLLPLLVLPLQSIL